MITVTAHGAAQEVTGSKHLLDTGAHRILVDCGVFQGRREESREKNEKFPFDPASIDVCVNTHGHLDHCGNYPLLVKRGFGGEILSTAATRDVAKLVMSDSARIQEADAAFVEKRQRKFPRPNRKAQPPLYGTNDADAAAARYVEVDYDAQRPLVPGVTVTLRDAGHILGSSIVVFDVAGEGGPLKVAFTGDLGRAGMPILRDPAELGAVDYLVCESTYGNRKHDDFAFAEEELAEIVRDTAAKGGRVIIPAFAIGRTQELVYNLHRLYSAGRIPKIPVFVDSPMAISATEIFGKHPECYDEETTAEFIAKGESPFAFDALELTRTVEQSKRINNQRMPCVVISASGMCEAGRILHHLLIGVGDHRNTILIVGFMAQNTLGRALADKKSVVRIFGEEHPVKARVKILNAFSAHADYLEIGRWVQRLDRSRLKAVFLVHGEKSAEEAMRTHLLSLGVPRVEILEAGKAVGLG
ncbi:MAG: MBL fold metallo-hydrolase [Proteobacteria bacterium]|jgi:metallo-beta-lactamase family protein|nr:MBL fold metallo-hydrolase [Pseudomonadota bacterium]